MNEGRKIYFGSVVSENFQLPCRLDEKLIERAARFWKNLGLVEKSVSFKEEEGSKIASFKAEGGSIWTTSFDKYKKVVRVLMVGVGEGTQVCIHLEFPGGYLSSADRRRVLQLFSSFQEYLRKVEPKAPPTQP